MYIFIKHKILKAFTVWTLLVVNKFLFYEVVLTCSFFCHPHSTLNNDEIKIVDTDSAFFSHVWNAIENKIKQSERPFEQYVLFKDVF